MSGRLMGGLTPLIWLAIVERAGLPWGAAFAIFAAIGLVWCALFNGWFRNRPEEKPEVNEAERALIGHAEHAGDSHSGVPWERLLTSPNLWTLCFMYFCAAYGWYFNITYLHTFLEEQHGVNPKSFLGAVYKGGPLWLGAVACLAGGILTDQFIRRTGDRKWGRRWFGIVGHGLCGICYVGCAFSPNAFLFFLAISLAAFFNDLTMGSAWAVCQDIGRRYAAIVAGCMNTIGNLGGAVAGWVTGTILEQHLERHAATLGKTIETLDKAEKAAGLLPGYEINFFIFAGVYALAVLLWLRIDPTRPVAEETA